MNKKNTLFLIAVMITVFGCGPKQLKGTEKITDVFGYKYIINMDTGTQAGNGIYLVANASVYNEHDSLVSDPNIGTWFSLDVPLRKEKSGSDMMKGFHKLSDGDSAVFIMLADTFFSKLNMNMPMPKNVKSGEYVKMYVQVIGLLDSSEYDYFLAKKEVQDKVLAQQMFQAYLRTANIVEEADANGIIKTIEKKGTGSSPKFGQEVSIHYICLTMSGKELENTYLKNEPYTFTLGSEGAIQGLNLALIYMKKGEKSRLVIPYYLAYGVEGLPGQVEPYTHLLMDVELLNFK